jgi:hypothetical protein
MIVHKVLVATRKYSLPHPRRRLCSFYVVYVVIVVTGRLLAHHCLSKRRTGHLCARPAPIANLDHGAIATDGEALHTATALRKRGSCSLCQDAPRSRSLYRLPNAVSTLLLAAGTRANHWARRAQFRHINFLCNWLAFRDAGRSCTHPRTAQRGHGLMH